METTVSYAHHFTGEIDAWEPGLAGCFQQKAYSKVARPLLHISKRVVFFRFYGPSVCVCLLLVPSEMQTE